jgi:hypothetical protein
MPKVHQHVDTSQWSELDDSSRLAIALDLYLTDPRHEQYSVRGLAEDFDISEHTLRAHVKYPEMRIGVLGRKSVYSRAQWVHIMLWALAAADRNHAKTVADIQRRIHKHLTLAPQVPTFRNNMPSEKTVNDVIEAIGGLAWRTARQVKYVIDAEQVAEARRSFHDALDEAIRKFRILPENIFNADEVGFNSKDATRSKVRQGHTDGRGCPCLHAYDSCTRSWMTTVRPDEVRAKLYNLRNLRFMIDDFSFVCFLSLSPRCRRCSGCGRLQHRVSLRATYRSGASR